jgi:hypothetical protein
MKQNQFFERVKKRTVFSTWMNGKLSSPAAENGIHDREKRG